MVAATEYPRRNSLMGTRDTEPKRPRKSRFRLLAALMAPFQDTDERALHKKHGPTGVVRNNSKGNLLTTRAAAPAKVPMRRFPRGDD
jgi:hypothetical protein